MIAVVSISLYDQREKSVSIVVLEVVSWSIEEASFVGANGGRDVFFSICETVVH
jgi:hypothetical protein